MMKQFIIGLIRFTVENVTYEFLNIYRFFQFKYINDSLMNVIDLLYE